MPDREHPLATSNRRRSAMWMLLRLSNACGRYLSSFITALYAM